MKDVSFTGVFLIARGLILCFQERLKLKFPERFHGFSERFFGYCCFVANSEPVIIYSLGRTMEQRCYFDRVTDAEANQSVDTQLGVEFSGLHTDLFFRP